MVQHRNLESTELPLNEKVININRVAKVVKGGKQLRFSALVVVGDGNGRVGFGHAKAREVPGAIRKAGAVARKDLVTILLAGNTIPHEVREKFGAAKVLIKPAAPGSGLKASGTVRAVLEAAGVKDAISKCLGNTNPVNMVKVTINALSRLKQPKDELARRRANAPAGGKEKVGG